MEMKVGNQGRVVSVDPDRVGIMMMSMHGTTPHESFGMLCLALSLIYRTASERTVDDFAEITKRQVLALIANPPKGYRTEDLGDPDPDCDCDNCETLRKMQSKDIHVQ